MGAPTCHQLPQRAREQLTAGRSRLIYSPYATATWRITRPSGEVCYLKAALVGAYPSLAAERDRYVWLRDRGVAVPEVIDHDDDGGVEWLLTAELPGVDATAPQHLTNPAVTVPLLADGLRNFHEIDLTDCPFDYRMPAAVAYVAGRVAAGDISVDGFMTYIGTSTRPQRWSGSASWPPMSSGCRVPRRLHATERPGWRRPGRGLSRSW